MSSDAAYDRLIIDLICGIVRMPKDPKELDKVIPGLICLMGDSNHPGWHPCVDTLASLSPEIVAPHLIRALVDKGEPYHQHSPWMAPGETTWDADLEAICLMLTTVDVHYAIACCPTINYLLNQSGLDDDCKDSFLDVLKHVLDHTKDATEQFASFLPTLILWARDKEEDVFGEISLLIRHFSAQAREPYKHLLDENGLISRSVSTNT